MPPSRRPFRLLSQAASTAGCYALFAALWIFFSDRILAAFVTDLPTLTLLQTVKGWFFVAVTTLLVYAMVHRHIARLLRSETDLQESEERYREMVEGTDDLITLVDADGRFTFVNHRADSYLGVAPADCIGLSAFDFVHPEDRDFTCAWFSRCLEAHGQSDCFENRQVSRSGRITPMLWTVNFRYHPDGRLEGIRSIARDISERKAAEHSLQEHLRMKSQFISTAAHELRTPLAAIMGYAELLLDQTAMEGFDAEERRGFVRTILQRSEVLAGIVDELLDLSRIESGQKIALDIQPCNLADVIHQTVADFRTRFPARCFILHIPPQCRHQCWADPGRMRQVVQNLLDNAVKYSSTAGAIEIGCATQAEACRIFVSDQGIGMTTEQKEHIFDPFYRANSADTAVSGLGLGLNLVREIVEGHGGRVEVESALGSGSTLTVVLPQGQPT